MIHINESNKNKKIKNKQMKKLLFLIIVLIPMMMKAQTFNFKTQVDNITCNGYADGSIHIDVVPTGDYTYTLARTTRKDTNSTGVFTDLAAGTYKASIISGKTVKTVKLVVVEPNKITAKFVVTRYPVKDYTTGSMTIIASGGVSIIRPALTSELRDEIQVSYSGKGSEYYADNLTADTYYLILEDDNGCRINKSFVLKNKKLK